MKVSAKDARHRLTYQIVVSKITAFCTWATETENIPNHAKRIKIVFVPPPSYGRRRLLYPSVPMSRANMRRRRTTVPQVVTLIFGCKRRSLLMAGDDDKTFMTRSLNVTPKTTELHLIARSDNSVAYVSNNKGLCSMFCTILANYWQTRSIARPLCDSGGYILVSLRTNTERISMKFGEFITTNNRWKLVN